MATKKSGGRKLTVKPKRKTRLSGPIRFGPVCLHPGKKVKGKKSPRKAK